MRRGEREREARAVAGAVWRFLLARSGAPRATRRAEGSPLPRCASQPPVKHSGGGGEPVRGPACPHQRWRRGGANNNKKEARRAPAQRADSGGSAAEGGARG